jgi:hypothetical protein
VVTPEEKPSASHRTPPHAFNLAGGAIIVAAIVFLVVMWIFSDKIGDGALVISALSTLFGVIGTIVGAYFGIKLTNDATDKTQDAVEKANDKANAALAEVDPEVGKRIIQESRRNR